MTTHTDTIIIGAGHNGLVTAAYLARAGWEVVVVEASPTLGGAVRSAELTRSGFIHDVCSTNQNGFLGGPVWAELGEDLQRHGLRYAHSDRPYANAFPAGGSLRVYQDAERTTRELAEHHPDDAEGWRKLGALFERYSPLVFGLYGSTMAPASLASLVATGIEQVGPAGMLELGALMTASTRQIGDAYFHSREAKAIMASWGMHVDFGPDVTGGAVFPFIECFADQMAGMSIVEGGASRMIDALAADLRAHGGQTRTDARVSRIDVRGGRAVGVTLADGEVLTAKRAVVASVTTEALYTKLLDENLVPASVRHAARHYAYGPGTMMVHVALDGPIPWSDPELASFAYVHVAPYVEDLAETYTDAMNGLLPASPLLVVGQSSVVDPSRAPAGKHVGWIQVRVVPARIAGDRLGTISAQDWTQAAEPYADRVMAKLEEVAPGVGDLVVERAVLTPRDLEALDANLVGGDNGAGSHHLHQNMLFRPLPGLSRYRTAVDGLWMTGAATWPGGGVTGLSGRLAALEILDDGRRGRRLRRSAQVVKHATGALWHARRVPAS